MANNKHAAKMVKRSPNSSWFREAVKSMGGASTEVIAEMIPFTSGTVKSVAAVTRDINKTVRQSRGPGKMLMNLFNNNELIKAGRDSLKMARTNAVSDLRAGNFNNTARSESSLLNSLGFDESSFSFDDTDFGDPDEGNENYNTTINNITPDTGATMAIREGIAEQVNATLTAAEATTNTIVAASSNMMISNQKLMTEVLDKLSNIDNNISSMLTYFNNNITKYIDASVAYYEQTAPSKKEDADKSSKKADADKVFTAQGMDLNAYADVVKSNLENSAGGSMFGIIKSFAPMMINDMKSNPLGVITKAVMKGIIPGVIKTSATAFDETLKTVMPVMFQRIGDLADSDNMVSSTIGKLFGIRQGRKTKFDKREYARGATPFDGETKLAITEVIPSYLRDILHALNGGEKQIYDKNAMKFRNLTDIQDETYGMIYNDIMSGFASTKFGKALSDSKNNFDASTKAFSKYEELQEKLIMSLYRHGKSVNPTALASDEMLSKLLAGGDASEYNNVKSEYKELIPYLKDVISRMKDSNAIQLDASWIASRRKANATIDRLSEDPTWYNLEHLNSEETLDQGLDRYHNKIHGVDQVRGGGSSAQRVKNSKSLYENVNMIRYLLDRGINVKILKGRTRGWSSTFEDNTADAESPTENNNESFTQAVSDATVNLHDEVTTTRPNTGVAGAIDSANNVLTAMITGGPDAAASAFGDIVRNGFQKAGTWLSANIFEPFKKIVFGEKDENGNSKNGMFSGIKNSFTDIINGTIHSITGKGYTKLNPADGEAAKVEDSEFSLSHKVKEIFTNVKKGVSDYLFGSEVEIDGVKQRQGGGFLGKMKDTLTSGLHGWSKFLFGEDGSTEESLKKIKENTQKMIPSTILGGVGGFLTEGLLGTSVLGTIITPGLGTLLGMGSSILFKSDKFQKWLFGYEKDGKHIKGVISKKTQETLAGAKNSMLGGATVGLVKSLIFPSEGGILAGIVGGPIAGAMMGAGLGLMRKAQWYQDLMYGKDVDGKHIDGIKDKIKRFFSSSGGRNREMGGGMKAGMTILGTIGGLGIGGLMGTGAAPLVGALLGGATGILGASDKFKQMLFGEKDENGKRSGGLFGKFKIWADVNMLRPLKQGALTMGMNMELSAKRMLMHFGTMLDPLRERINIIKESFVETLTNIGENIKSGLTSVLFTPIKNMVKIAIKPVAFLGKTAGNFAIQMIKAPMDIMSKVLSSAGSALDIRNKKSIIRTAMRNTRKEIVSAITDPFKSIFQSIKKSGGGIIKKISDGIFESISLPLRNGAESLGQWLKDRVKSALLMPFKLLGGLLSLPFKLLGGGMKAIGKVGRVATGGLAMLLDAGHTRDENRQGLFKSNKDGRFYQMKNQLSEMKAGGSSRFERMKTALSWLDPGQKALNDSGYITTGEYEDTKGKKHKVKSVKQQNKEIDKSIDDERTLRSKQINEMVWGKAGATDLKLRAKHYKYNPSEQSQIYLNQGIYEETSATTTAVRELADQEQKTQNIFNALSQRTLLSDDTGAAIANMARQATTPGSMYTHDIHLEGIVGSIYKLLVSKFTGESVSDDDLNKLSNPHLFTSTVDDSVSRLAATVGTGATIIASPAEKTAEEIDAENDEARNAEFKKAADDNYEHAKTATTKQKAAAKAAEEAQEEDDRDDAEQEEHTSLLSRIWASTKEHTSSFVQTFDLRKGLIGAGIALLIPNVIKLVSSFLDGSIWTGVGDLITGAVGTLWELVTNFVKDVSDAAADEGGTEGIINNIEDTGRRAMGLIPFVGNYNDFLYNANGTTDSLSSAVTKSRMKFDTRLALNVSNGLADGYNKKLFMNAAVNGNAANAISSAGKIGDDAAEAIAKATDKSTHFSQLAKTAKEYGMADEYAHYTELSQKWATEADDLATAAAKSSDNAVMAAKSGFGLSDNLVDIAAKNPNLTKADINKIYSTVNDGNAKKIAKLSTTYGDDVIADMTKVVANTSSDVVTGPNALLGKKTNVINGWIDNAIKWFTEKIGSLFASLGGTKAGKLVKNIAKCFSKTAIGKIVVKVTGKIGQVIGKAAASASTAMIAEIIWAGIGAVDGTMKAAQMFEVPADSVDDTMITIAGTMTALLSTTFGSIIDIISAALEGVLGFNPVNWLCQQLYMILLDEKGDKAYEKAQGELRSDWMNEAYERYSQSDVDGENKMSREAFLAQDHADIALKSNLSFSDYNAEVNPDMLGRVTKWGGEYGSKVGSMYSQNGADIAKIAEGDVGSFARGLVGIGTSTTRTVGGLVGGIGGAAKEIYGTFGKLGGAASRTVFNGLASVFGGSKTSVGKTIMSTGAIVGGVAEIFPSVMGEVTNVVGAIGEGAVDMASSLVDGAAKLVTTGDVGAVLQDAGTWINNKWNSVCEWGSNIGNDIGDWFSTLVGNITNPWCNEETKEAMEISMDAALAGASNIVDQNFIDGFRNQDDYADAYAEVSKRRREYQDSIAAGEDYVPIFTNWNGGVVKGNKPILSVLSPGEIVINPADAKTKLSQKQKEESLRDTLYKKIRTNTDTDDLNEDGSVVNYLHDIDKTLSSIHRFISGQITTVENDKLTEKTAQTFADIFKETLRPLFRKHGTGRGDDDEDHGAGSKTKNVDGAKLYQQEDPTWSKSKYSDLDIHDSGCGPTAASIAASVYGSTMNPITAASIINSSGYRDADGGTDPRGIEAAGDAYGITMREGSVNKQSIVNSLSKGNPVIMMGQDNSGSVYGDGMHYVVGTSYDKTTGKVNILDPLKSRPTSHNLSSFIGDTSTAVYTAGKTPRYRGNKKSRPYTNTRGKGGAMYASLETMSQLTGEENFDAKVQKSTYDQLAKMGITGAAVSEEAWKSRNINWNYLINRQKTNTSLADRTTRSDETSWQVQLDKFLYDNFNADYDYLVSTNNVNWMSEDDFAQMGVSNLSKPAYAQLTSKIYISQAMNELNRYNSAVINDDGIAQSYTKNMYDYTDVGETPQNIETLVHMFETHVFGKSLLKKDPYISSMANTSGAWKFEEKYTKDEMDDIERFLRIEFTNEQGVDYSKFLLLNYGHPKLLGYIPNLMKYKSEYDKKVKSIYSGWLSNFESKIFPHLTTLQDALLTLSNIISEMSYLDRAQMTLIYKSIYGNMLKNRKDNTAMDVIDYLAMHSSRIMGNTTVQSFVQKLIKYGTSAEIQSQDTSIASMLTYMDGETLTISGNKAQIGVVVEMLRKLNKLTYSTSQRQNIEGGFSDSSSIIAYAYENYLKLPSKTSSYPTAQDMLYSGKAIDVDKNIATLSGNSPLDGLIAGLKPGDLIFYKHNSDIDYVARHVEMYIGNGKMAGNLGINGRKGTHVTDFRYQLGSFRICNIRRFIKVKEDDEEIQVTIDPVKNTITLGDGTTTSLGEGFWDKLIGFFGEVSTRLINGLTTGKWDSNYDSYWSGQTGEEFSETEYTAEYAGSSPDYMTANELESLSVDSDYVRETSTHGGMGRSRNGQGKNVHGISQKRRHFGRGGGSTSIISEMMSDTSSKLNDYMWGKTDKLTTRTVDEISQGITTNDDNSVHKISEDAVFYTSESKPDGFFRATLPGMWKSSNFAEKSKYWNPYHKGVDYAVAGGTPIYSPVNGKIVRNDPVEKGGGFGNVTVIEDDKGYRHYFAHQQKLSSWKVGDRIKRGQQVGIVGTTGLSTGDHLHYQINADSNSGSFINPNDYSYEPFMTNAEKVAAKDEGKIAYHTGFNSSGEYTDSTDVNNKTSSMISSRNWAAPNSLGKGGEKPATVKHDINNSKPINSFISSNGRGSGADVSNRVLEVMATKAVEILGTIADNTLSTADKLDKIKNSALSISGAPTINNITTNNGSSKTLNPTISAAEKSARKIAKGY